MAPNFGAIFVVKIDGREPGQTPWRGMSPFRIVISA
jgi:hypothetical protein